MSLGSPRRVFKLQISCRLGHECIKCGAHRSPLAPSLLPFLPNSRATGHFTPRVVKNEKHSSVTHLPSRYFSRTRLSPFTGRGNERAGMDSTQEYASDGRTDGRRDGQLPAFITLQKRLGGGRRRIYTNMCKNFC